LGKYGTIIDGKLASESRTNWEKILLQCQSIHNKSHMKSLGLNLRLRNGKPKNCVISSNKDKPKFLS